MRLNLGLSGFSALEHYRLGQCVAEAAQSQGRRVAFVASGDLSHKLRADGPYGFAPEGPAFDRQVTDTMRHTGWSALRWCGTQDFRLEYQRRGA